MGALLAVLAPMGAVIGFVLRIGRGIGIVAIAIMVVAILIQVVARYMFNNALPWPDEAARFFMLWMTGLMAPTAFRRGGFVALDMISALLSIRVAAMLSLILLLISVVILFIAVQIGWSEVTGFGGRFATASLYIPTFDGWFRIPRSWMMLSLLVGVILLLVVNVELILRNIVQMLGGGDRLPEIEMGKMVGPE